MCEGFFCFRDLLSIADVAVDALVCPIQCPNERTTEREKDSMYIDADIPKRYSFSFQTLRLIFFM